jgi:hypothetical protein
MRAGEGRCVPERGDARLQGVNPGGSVQFAPAGIDSRRQGAGGGPLAGSIGGRRGRWRPSRFVQIGGRRGRWRGSARSWRVGEDFLGLGRISISWTFSGSGGSRSPGLSRAWVDLDLLEFLGLGRISISWTFSGSGGSRSPSDGAERRADRGLRLVADSL